MVLEKKLVLKVCYEISVKQTGEIENHVLEMQ